jgi:hypothetical protein
MANRTINDLTPTGGLNADDSFELQETGPSGVSRRVELSVLNAYFSVGPQNTYKTFDANSGTPTTANSPTDTLTIVGGINVDTIVSDDTITDTITINHIQNIDFIYPSPFNHPQQYLDKTKILIVYDSTNQDSQDVADNYITSRGLTSHKLGIDFSATISNGDVWDLGWSGDTNNPNQNYYNAMSVPIDSYIQANDIKAVFLSGMTPTRVKCYNRIGDGSQMACLPNLAGSSPYIVLNGKFPWNNFINPTPQIFTNGATPTILRDQINAYTDYGAHLGPYALTITGMPATQNYDDTESSKFRPVGRIGSPNHGSGTFPAETVANINTLVESAIANERTVQEVAQEQLPFHIGVSSRLPPQLTAEEGAAIVDICRRLGFNVEYYYNNAADLNSGLPLVVTPLSGALYSVAEVEAQTAPQNQPVWCTIGYAIENDAWDDAEWRSLWNHLPGAWGVEGTSSMQQHTRRIQYDGGIGGIMNTAEPFAIDGGEILNWFWVLLSGVSIAEAHYQTNHLFCWQSAPVGDPLYAPFGKGRY